MYSDLEAARRDQPSTAALRAALVAATEAGTIERERAERLVEAESAAHFAAEAAAHASAELHRRAVALHLPAGRPALADVRRELDRCDAQIGRVTDALESQAQAAALARDAAENAVSTRRLADEASATATARRDADAAETEALRYDRFRRDVGADAQQAIEDLAAARKRREAAAGRMAELQVARRELEATMARLDERIAQLIASEERLERVRTEASIRFRPVCSTDVADVLDEHAALSALRPRDLCPPASCAVNRCGCVGQGRSSHCWSSLPSSTARGPCCPRPSRGFDEALDVLAPGTHIRQAMTQQRSRSRVISARWKRPERENATSGEAAIPVIATM